MELIGRLTRKFDTATVSEKFKKREFVLTIEEQTPYPQPLIIQVTQDKCAILDQFTEDDEIKVQFNLRGREWEGPQGTKFFNTIEAWRIELVAKGSGPKATTKVTDTRTQAEKDVEAALAKLDPATREAMLKSMGGNAQTTNPAQTTSPAPSNDDLDLPF